jgi:hypothetical protein
MEKPYRTKARYTMSAVYSLQLIMIETTVHDAMIMNRYLRESVMMGKDLDLHGTSYTFQHSKIQSI